MSKSTRTQNLTIRFDKVKNKAILIAAALCALSILTYYLTQHVPSVESSPGLVAYWSFDEDGGSIIKDSVDGLEGDVYGAMSEKGKKGNALYFDGVDDYIQLSKRSFDRISKLSHGTVAFWFKFESVLDKQSIMPIFYMGASDDKKEDNILIIEVGHFKQGNLRTQDPDNKRLYSTFIKDNGHPFLCLDSGRNMEEGVWTHYALVSGENGTNVYINGEGIPANYNFGGLSDAYFLADVPDAEVLMIGRGKTSSMATPDFVYYKGLIDELKVYEKPLTQSEIKELL
ncbi:MAG: LamG domain-containing protein [Candidatus Altiarchaeales archaeon]|nr:LamG domain-containing protein [Candidatus Altiarchaeales archaeon]